MPQEKVQELYEEIVFMTLGESFKICEHINGVRIVDTAAKNKFQCRI